VLVATHARPDEWAVVREIRLRALADSPDAFTSTWDRESRFSENEWRDRVERGHWFLAWREEQPVGVAAIILPSPAAGDAELVAMWVTPELRGTPTAQLLVETACAWLAGTGIRTVGLWVVEGNTRAQRFYSRLRFLATGEREQLGGRADEWEIRMRRTL
jgi:GNAT superfamily N-acetyltransferase